MESTGTIPFWKTDEGVNILFPQTKLVFGHGTKTRGGAHVCCPNFGTAPTDGPYRDITLPQHGLVRGSSIFDGKATTGNCAFHQSEPGLVDGEWIEAGFAYNHPWPHRVWVAAKKVQHIPSRSQHLKHRLRLSTENVYDQSIPYSLGFHPYFATHGTDFELRHGEESWKKEDLHVNKPLFVPYKPGGLFVLKLDGAIIQIYLTTGYNGFYVWTDRPDLYVCIEPVCVGVKNRYQMLEPGGTVNCECSIRYAPIG